MSVAFDYEPLAVCKKQTFKEIKKERRPAAPPLAKGAINTLISATDSNTPLPSLWA